MVNGTIAVHPDRIADTARQDALNRASIEVCEGLGAQAKVLQHPESNAIRQPFHPVPQTDWSYL